MIAGIRDYSSPRPAVPNWLQKLPVAACYVQPVNPTIRRLPVVSMFHTTKFLHSEFAEGPKFLDTDSATFILPMFRNP